MKSVVVCEFYCIELGVLLSTFCGLVVGWCLLSGSANVLFWGLTILHQASSEFQTKEHYCDSNIKPSLQRLSMGWTYTHSHTHTQTQTFSFTHRHIHTLSWLAVWKKPILTWMYSFGLLEFNLYEVDFILWRA